MGIVMLTFNEYTTISNNCSDNKQLSDAINSVCSAALEESSVISHEIKNQAAYLKTCYQLLSSRNDELRSNKFWNNMGSTIDELVNYLERTSIYRYSFKQSETVSCTLSDIINNINEYIKSRYNGLIALDTSDISLECSSASIYASSHYLNIALKEIIDNAYEAASERNCNNCILILSAIMSPDIKDQLILSIGSNKPITAALFTSLIISAPALTMTLMIITVTDLDLKVSSASLSTQHTRGTLVLVFQL